MKKLLLAILAAISIFSSFTCDTTEPTEEIYPPGRRDYVWTVDTVESANDHFFLLELWGTSPSNIWAVGHGDESVNSLWHYDGIKWGKTTQRLSSNLQAIFGFDSSNVWICDSPGGNVFHFDGSNWVKKGTFSYQDYSFTFLNDIWGSNPNEVYIGGAAYSSDKGTRAILLKCVNNMCEYITLPSANYSLALVMKNRQDNKLYFTAYESSPYVDSYKVVSYDQGKLKEIISGSNPVTINEMNGLLYITTNKTIYKYINDNLVVWKDFKGTTFIGRLWGRNEHDFFGIASDGLAHFNGTDLKIIFPTDLFIDNMLVMEKDIYVLCENRIIIHGSMKDH